jgi:nitrous oxide reductase accessory protein NosL
MNDDEGGARETEPARCEHHRGRWRGQTGDDTDDSAADDGGRRVTRRTLLAGSGAVAAGTVAGCLGGVGGGGQAPAAISLTTEHTCDVCGMVIPNHPGPSTEIFYADRQPSGHDNPARFDSTWEAFQYDFERRDRGWKRLAFYVTDYSSVDYDLLTEGGDTLISTHPEAEAFVDASSVTFVVGSDVNGAMGKDLIAFSKRADAESFSQDHGGTLAEFGDVTPGMVEQLGMS